MRIAQRRPRRPQGQHLGVGRGIACGLAGIGRLRQGLAVGPEDDGAHRHLAGPTGTCGQGERTIHRGAVARLDQTASHALSSTHDETPSKI